jgi:hypothetical protein
MEFSLPRSLKRDETAPRPDRATAAGASPEPDLAPDPALAPDLEPAPAPDLEPAAARGLAPAADRTSPVV